MLLKLLLAMAIAFGRSGKNGAVSTPASPLVVTVTINAGETGFALVELTDGTGAVSSMPAGWTKRGEVVFTNFNRVKTELWSTEAGAAAAVASVSIAFTGAPITVVAIVAAYTGVLSLGNVSTPAGSNTANPSIALATQDPNNYIIACFGCADVTAATAGTGTLRDQQGSGAGTDAFIALTDNTSATPASVTNSITKVAADFGRIAFELRSVSGSVQPPLLSRWSRVGSVMRPARVSTVSSAVAASFRRTSHPFGAGKGKRTKGR